VRVLELDAFCRRRLEINGGCSGRHELFRQVMRL